MAHLHPTHAFAILLAFSACNLSCSTDGDGPGPGAPLYFPPLSGSTWETLTPAEAGLDENALRSLDTFLEINNTKGFVMLQNGRIVFEKYYGTFTKDSLHVWNSAGKCLTALMTGIAQEDGLLTLDDPVSRHLGRGWTSLPPAQEDNITVKHQLSMTTGLDESPLPNCTDPQCLTFKAAPGTRWFYHNAPYTLIGQVLERVSGKDLNIYTQQTVKNKIGLDGFWIRLGYSRVYASTPRGMARFGLLIQNKGEWDGNKVLEDQGYFQAMTTSSQTLNPAYGYLWWLNGKNSYIPPGIPFSSSGSMAPAAPAGMICAAGLNGQFICVVPEKNLVVVRVGGNSSDNLAALDLLNSMWAEISKAL